MALSAPFLFSPMAWAGGPRFVTGQSYASQGLPMAFRVSQISYYTDPGALNGSVSHAAADAVVAAAAAVWNVPTASLALSQGGVLSEDVSGNNTYFDGTSVVFPADVQPSNYLARPVAVIYDADGTVTDLLLGAGASSTTSCRQNEVTESVDAFGASGTIDHALLIINGLCVQSTTDSLKQMQYMMMRAFGRILGLGWSQVNDNVFTIATTPTQQQMAYWPVMHPIDVLCNVYTYLCMTNPFSLRVDDLGALSMLYPVTSANLTSGKTLSSANALSFQGWLRNNDGYGTGSGSINITVQLIDTWALSDWQYASGVSGYLFQQNVGNPVTGAPVTTLDQGSQDTNLQGYFNVPRVPTVSADTGYVVAMETVNPLYNGHYALGAWQRPPITAPVVGNLSWGGFSGDTTYYINGTVDAGPEQCFTSSNGSESAPVAADASGWWSDVLCGVQRPAWSSTPLLKAGHSWTLESLALDENSYVSGNKAQPVLGVWRLQDAIGTLPTVAKAATPMNGRIVGLTQLKVAASKADGQYRVGIADYYGDGQPDFLYKARLLYADSVSPSTLAAAGGQFTIFGMGFANGNQVLVNGVAATVTSWAADRIVAIAPSSVTAKATSGAAVAVTVNDLTTGGTTAIAGAISYALAGAYQLVKVSAPSALETGVTSTTPFAVRVLSSDGLTPIAGASVRLSVSAGSAALSACGVTASCVLTTDATGQVQTAVTGAVAGDVTLNAVELSSGSSVQVTILDSDPVRSVAFTNSMGWVAAGGKVWFPVTLIALQDDAPASAVPVQWSVSSGLLLSASSTLTDASGSATVSVGSNGVAAGSLQLQGCAWTSVCATWTLNSLAEDQWVPLVASGAGQSITVGSSFQPVEVQVTDAAGNLLPGATVTIAQTVTAWEGPCADQGRCAAAPVLASSQVKAVTDASGSVRFSPLEVEATAGSTNIAVSTGTNGFVALTLMKTPQP